MIAIIIIIKNSYLPQADLGDARGLRSRRHFICPIQASVWLDIKATVRTFVLHVIVLVLSVIFMFSTPLANSIWKTLAEPEERAFIFLRIWGCSPWSWKLGVGVWMGGTCSEVRKSCQVRKRNSYAQWEEGDTEKTLSPGPIIVLYEPL